MTTTGIGVRHLALEGAYNIRDIGGYATKDGHTTRWRTFLRADALHRLTPSSQQFLIDYGVRTMIDLRHDDELAAAPNVFGGSSWVTYHHVSLFAGASPSGNRDMPPDLEAIYRYVLDHRQAALNAVFRTITADAFPVLVHCTAGKDRTGLITALLLDLAGVHPATIAQDYGLTTYYAADLFAELRTQAAATGRDMALFERYLEAKPEAMFNTLAYLGQAYGGAADYLRHIGLAKMQINELRQVLIN